MSNLLSNEHRQYLLTIAKQSIQHGFSHHKALDIKLNDVALELQQARASFVTLNIDQQLRGCIGSLVAHRPLIADIAHNAYAAAFSDPRFPALANSEFEQLHYHLSILSESQPMEFSSEADFLQQIRPEIDGLILKDKGLQATFLPSVWEQLPHKSDFLLHLKLKAGLPENYWSDTITISRYTVESIT